MKKLYLLFLLLIFSCNNETLDTQEEAACDGGTYVGNVSLTTQAEVNDFGSNCYTKIEGSLYIGEEHVDSDILDLSPLESVTNVSGYLSVFAMNLPNLRGLHNVAKAGSLTIRGCDELVDLSGLESLTTIHDGVENKGFFFLMRNSSLESLRGVENLQIIESIFQFGLNNKLTNLDHLSSLREVGSIMSKSNCYYTSVDAFDGCGNEMLSDFCGLRNLLMEGTYGDIVIDKNLYNPTVEDIIDGNCSQ